MAHDTPGVGRRQPGRVLGEGEMHVRDSILRQLGVAQAPGYRGRAGLGTGIGRPLLAICREADATAPEYETGMLSPSNGLGRANKGLQRYLGPKTQNRFWPNGQMHQNHPISSTGKSVWPEGFVVCVWNGRRRSPHLAIENGPPKYPPGSKAGWCIFFATTLRTSRPCPGSALEANVGDKLALSIDFSRILSQSGMRGGFCRVVPVLCMPLYSVGFGFGWPSICGGAFLQKI